MEIAAIKQQLTLARVLQHYGLKPDKHLRLHCPFHDDSTPSLQVYYKTHTAYCFSANCPTTGRSMDVIDFVLHKEQCSKQEAIAKCIALLDGPAVAAASFSRIAVLTRMFTYFKNAVHNSQPAQAYIRQRELDATRLEIGYNTAQFHHGSRKEAALIQSCVTVGLLIPWGANKREGGQAYKPFGKYCIVFALRNVQQQVCGLYFRSTVNDTAQRHFYLRDRQGLYPQYPAKTTTKLILTESIIDAATLLQVDSITKTYSVLALYGTNGLTTEHQAALQNLPSLTELVLWLNADEAGAAATVKYAAQLSQLLPAVTITTVVMPAGEDINSLAQTHHDDQLLIDLLQSRQPVTATAVAGPAFSFSTAPAAAATTVTTTTSDATTSSSSAVPGLDTTHPWKLRYATAAALYTVQGGVPKSADTMKVMLVVEATHTSAKARNRIDLYEERQVEKLCKELCDKLGLAADQLETDLYRLTDLLDDYREQHVLPKASDPAAPVVVLSAQQRSELEAFASGPRLLKRLNEQLGATGIIGEERNRIFLWLIALSHRMTDTLHALIQGSSGSGKTRLLKQVTACMPPEQVTKLTRLSDKVLYNYPEHYFVNRLLCLEDIDGLSEEAEFALRELQSNGELNSATSIKLDNGQITSGQKTVRGPIASLACTTHGEIYEDNMSRMFLIAVDESAEQTERIIAYQNSVAAGVVHKGVEVKAKQFLQNLVRILQPCEVINPYAQSVRLPTEAHKVRRLNDLFQSFIKLVTILHQYQRERDAQRRLITQVEDVEMAVAVMFESIVLKVDELDGSLRQFFERLKQYLQQQHGNHYEQAAFSLREVRQSLKCSKTQVFRYIADLVELQYVRQSGGYGNRGFTYTICYWDHYQALRDKIRAKLDEQLALLKSTPSSQLTVD